MLSCIYWGALFGGAITSILFNIPGEPWSVATTFDGYPLAQQGRAGEALTAAFTSSFVGALVAVLMITFLAPLVAKFALRVRPARVLRGLPADLLQLRRHGQGAAVQDRSPSMMLGFALAAVGMDTVTGQLRMTFGSTRAAARLRLPDRGDRPVRHRRDPAHDGGRAGVQRRKREDQPERGARDLEEAAALLGDLAAQLGGRLLDGHHAGRRDAGLVHELRPGASACRKRRRQVRHGRDRRRGRARDRGARRRHQRAAADADARHPGLAHRGGAARRPADLGPAARAAAVRRAEGLRLGPDRAACTSATSPA